MLDDQYRQELLRSSAAYTTAKLAFANAIVAKADLARRRWQPVQERAEIRWRGDPVPVT